MLDPVILGDLIGHSTHDDACPNCYYGFVAANETICRLCRDFGYRV